MKNLTFFACLLLATTLAAQPRPIQVEPNHSTVGFRISIAGFTAVTGKFTDFSIDLDWDETDASTSNISAEINAASIDTGIDGRDEHLRTADFFDAEKYPTITFQSASVKQLNHYQFVATGDFMMHGVTKTIDLPFELVKMDGNTLGFRSRTTLNRIEYGVGADWEHSSMPDFLSDEIQVEIDFWTKKRKVD